MHPANLNSPHSPTVVRDGAIIEEKGKAPGMNNRESFLREVKEAGRGLSAESIVSEADRPISLALIAEDAGKLRQMEGFFAPQLLGSRKADQVRERLCFFVLPLRPSEQEGLLQLDLVVSSEGAAGEVQAMLPQIHVYSAKDPQSMVRRILKEHWDLALPLAKNFLPFRQPVARRFMRSIALENALFTVMAATAKFLPAPLSLFSAVGGSSSTSLFLTANQMRLAFLIAAAHDSAVGFRVQTGQVTAIAAAALGWRSLAHDIERKVSPSNSLLAKGLLAFVATYATGLALEQLHTLGRHMTREEKSVAYDHAYSVGSRVIERFLDIKASRDLSRQ